MDKPLKFVSNVIELKPNHKYLLVFKGDITRDQVDHATALLQARGIRAVSLRIGSDDNVDVIEVPEEQE